MPFNAEGKWIPEDQSVATKLNGLLADDSKYLKQARHSGVRTANKRGLLNSSMAAGAAETAAISAAAPIASQDASQIAAQNLTYQQGNISKDLQDDQQGHSLTLQERDLASRRELQDADLASRSELQETDIANQRFLQGRDLESRSGLLGLELESRERLSENELASRENLLNTELNSRSDLLNRELNSRADLQTQSLSSQERLQLAGFANQRALQEMSDAAAALRQKAQIEGALTQQERSDLAAMERQLSQLSSQERQALLSSETTIASNRIAASSQMTSSYLTALGNLSANPDISAGDRNAYIAELQRVTNQGRAYSQSLPGVALSWGDNSSGNAGIAPANPTAPTAVNVDVPTVNPVNTASPGNSIGGAPVNTNLPGGYNGLTAGLLASNASSLNAGDAGVSGGPESIDLGQYGLVFRDGRWQPA